ncbi:MAG: hypothetical protein ACKOS8_10555 [Gemmataceae bacterium]
MRNSLIFSAVFSLALASLTGCGDGAKKSPDEGKKGMIKPPQPGKDAVRPDAGKAPEGDAKK